ncbi:MAG: LLM class flavin-dependent oxidoreductase [Chloroflexota bacterium]|nr:LLM class flavin-dependent oxidoreductase [Chloroflexota bacterium]
MPRVQFGFCVPIFAAPGLHLFRTPSYRALDTAQTMTLARQAEALGYDSVWVADHLMRGEENAILEGWTVLAALAGSTARVTLGLIHQTHFFRPPALVAKMVATLDQISNGRFVYFLDCGNQRDEYLAYGLPWDDDSETRVARMVEGLALTLALWESREAVTFAGAHYRLDGAVCNPGPVQQPHPPIWFGGVNPAMLRACARYGQGWNTTPVSVQQVREHIRALSAACAEVGRSADELEKSLEMQILIAPDRAALRQRLQTIADLDPSGQPLAPALRAFLAGETDVIPDMHRVAIIGTAEEVRQRIQEYIDAGIAHFMLWFLDAPSDEGMTLFAERVLPAVRAAAV